MKHIADIQPNGFIVDNEYHKTIGEMLQQRDAAILHLSGDKAIVYGVTEDGANTTGGVVTYNGKLYTFVGGVTQANITTKKEIINRPNADQIDAPAFYKDIITFGNDGYETFPFADLKRVKTLQELEVLESLVNIPSDWNQTDDKKKDFIKNKPSLLTKKVFGKISIGDVGTSTTPTHSGDITSVVLLDNDSDDMRFRVNFPSVGTSSYLPMLQVVSKSSNYEVDNDVFTSVKNITATTFEILVREVQPITQNIDILIQIIA